MFYLFIYLFIYLFWGGGTFIVFFCFCFFSELMASNGLRSVGGLQVASGWLMQTPLGLFVLASGWLTSILLALFVIASGWFTQILLALFVLCYSQWVAYVILLALFVIASGWLVQIRCYYVS